MIKFPSIEQFKNVIRNVKHANPSATVLPFQGTVKLHGTNAAIVFGSNGVMEYQSRNRILTAEDDNAGFVAYMENDVGESGLRALEASLRCSAPIWEDIDLVVYGEWCGGNIQSGVAICQLPKMFVIFGIRAVLGEEQYKWIEPVYWHDISFPEFRIYNIHQFPTFNTNIDFDRPALVQNTLGEITQKVEEECPVGKHFGVSGVGEGVVWRCTHPEFNSSDFWFKVKGEKHSVSKVKTLAAVDVEKVKAVDEFIENVVTENRLNQGIDYLKEMGKELSQRSTGDFLSWVFADIVKEESDVIEASGFEKKDYSGPISAKAKNWFFKKCEEI